MAENKKSFLLYADLIHTVRKMPKDKAGDLFLTILQYVNDENPDVQDLMIDLVFEPIKQQLKRDLKKWEAYIKKQRDNGEKGGRPTKTQKTQAFIENPPQPKKADNVNVNVTDTVNVIEKYNPNSLSPKMVEIFKASYPYYPVDEKEDFTSCLNIAHKIAKQKGWQRETVLNGNMSLTLEAWEKIVLFSTTDKWYATRSISDFNREFQRIVQGMVHSSKKHSTKKEEEKLTAAPLTHLKHD